MKKLKVFLLVCLLVIPFSVRADENITEEKKFAMVFDNNVISETNVDGSGIYAGNTVTFDKEIKGIGFLFGSTVNYEGNSQYAILGGNSLRVKGSIDNDGFIFGNVIDFDKEFKTNRDLIIFGNDVKLRGNIARDVTIYAATVTLENVTVTGDIKIYASNIETKDEVAITGTLSYNKDASMKMKSNESIGEIVLLDKIMKDVTFKDQVLSFIIRYAGILVIFLFLALLVPSLFKRIEKKTEEANIFKVFVMIGIGALTLIAVPLVFILLCMLAFGIQLALLLLAIYIIIICLSMIFSGYVIGYIIFKRIFKKDVSPLLVGLVGITVVMILTYIPYIATFATVLSLLLSLGTVVYLFKKD